MQKQNFYQSGQSLIWIVIVLVAVGLITGGLYLYLSKQIPEVSKITRKVAEEKIVKPEEKPTTTPETTCQNECSPLHLTRCVEKDFQVCGYYDEDNCLEWGPIINCPANTICQNGSCVSTTTPPPEIVTPTPRPGEPVVLKCVDGTPYSQCSTQKPKYCKDEVLIDRASLCGCPTSYKISDNQCVIIEPEVVIKPETILPKNAKCFWQNNRDKPECYQYYKEENGWKSLACPQYFNPVYDSGGVFYPSACWAEQLGATVKGYGYSSKFTQFIRDLWRTNGYEVPSPNIEFTYQGSGTAGGKNGTWIRSVLWKGTSNFVILDFNIETSQDSPLSTMVSERTTFQSVINYNPRALLAFIMFDKAYPEQVLLDWTTTYTNFMNDYIKKKQRVPNPIQYNITPVIISPPQGVERPSASHLFFSNEEIQKMYDAAIQKIGPQNFKIFTVGPVFINGFGGYYTWWNNMEFIVAPLIPPTAYSATDKKAGLNALAAFQQMFLTISHEVLHAVGLPGDHMLMGYGTYYLDFVGQNVDSVTGKEKEGPDACDFLGTSPNYYSVELPSVLKIFVGQEPTWLSKTKSPSGDCLSGLYNNEHLKDYDKNGEYKIMYKNNLIGKELQRSLGWIDIDGDNIAELIDTNAYGGWRKK